MMTAVDFSDLLKHKLPERDVEVAGFKLRFRALSSHALDELMTKHPGKKDQNFGDGMVAELIALSSVDPVMTTDEVEQLFKTWSRPDVLMLQDAVFRLSFTGEEDKKLPLSGKG